MRWEDRQTTRRRVLIPVLAASLLLNAAALGWISWIVADPSYWFPAYAERGERGPVGPIGAQGPVGPPGPVGPDAEDAVASLSSDVDDLTARLEDLEAGQGTSELESDVDDLVTRVDEICNQFSISDAGLLNDIYYAAC
jgi:hypothetical protein